MIKLNKNFLSFLIQNIVKIKSTFESMEKWIRANKEFINSKDDCGLNALHYAILLNKPELVELLLQNEAGMCLYMLFSYLIFHH